MCFMPLTRESYCIDKVMHPSMAFPEDNRDSHRRHGGDPDEDEPGSWILLWYYDEANVQLIGIWHQVRAAWSQKLFLFYMLFSTLLRGWRHHNQATVFIMEMQYLSIPREAFQALLPPGAFLEGHLNKDGNNGNPLPFVALPPWSPIYMWI